jgi:hypothetical protein
MTTESRFRVGDKVRRVFANGGVARRTALGDTGVVTDIRADWTGRPTLSVRLDKNGAIDGWQPRFAEPIEPPVSAQVAELEAALEDARHRQAAAEQQADKLRSQVHELQRSQQDLPPMTALAADEMSKLIADVLCGRTATPHSRRAIFPYTKRRPSPNGWHDSRDYAEPNYGTVEVSW